MWGNSPITNLRLPKVKGSSNFFSKYCYVDLFDKTVGSTVYESFGGVLVSSHDIEDVE